MITRTLNFCALALFVAATSSALAQNWNWSPAITVPVNSQPISIAAADLNGDGKVDLVSACWDDDAVNILTNDGFGAFVLAATYNVGSSPSAIAVADINGDAHPDLLVANSR